MYTKIYFVYRYKVYQVCAYCPLQTRGTCSHERSAYSCLPRGAVKPEQSLLYQGIHHFLCFPVLRGTCVATISLVLFLGCLFPVRFDFELQVCIFRSRKNEANLLIQSEDAKSDRIFFDFRIQWPTHQVRRPRVVNFSNGKLVLLPTTASSRRTIDEWDGDTVV